MFCCSCFFRGEVPCFTCNSHLVVRTRIRTRRSTLGFVLIGCCCYCLFIVVADVVVNKAQCVCVDTFLNYHGGFILSWLVYVWEQQTDTHIHTHRWEDNNNREDPREDPERFVRLVIDGGGGKNRLM